MRISFFSLMLCGVAHMGSRQALADDPSWDSTQTTLTFKPDVNTSLTYSSSIGDSSTANGRTSGPSSVLKIGDGTAILTSQGNSYSGPTSINAGILQLGDGSRTGSISNSSINIGQGATLAFKEANTDNVTMSNPITGDEASIVQNGSGSTTLIQTSGYKGGLTVNNGTLQLGDGQATGNFGQYSSITNTSITNNGTLTLAPGNGGGTITAPIIGTGILRLVGQDVTTLAYDKDKDQAQTALQSSWSSTQSSSSPTMTLTGKNLYTGETQIAYGTLALGAGATLESSVIHTGYRGVFSIAGAYGTDTGTVKVQSILDNGQEQEGGGKIEVGSNTLDITNQQNTGQENLPNPGTDDISKYAGAIVGGSGGLTLEGGRLAITGNNTYTGTTTVEKGAFLELDGTSASTKAVIKGNSTLRASSMVAPQMEVDSSTIGPSRLGGLPGQLSVLAQDTTDSHGNTTVSAGKKLALTVDQNSTSDFTPQYAWATQFNPVPGSNDPSANVKYGTSSPSSVILNSPLVSTGYENEPNLYSGRLKQGNIFVAGKLDLNGTIQTADLSPDLGSGVQTLYMASARADSRANESVIDTTNLALINLTTGQTLQNDIKDASSSPSKQNNSAYLNDNTSNGSEVVSLVTTRPEDHLSFWNGTSTSASTGVVGGSGTWSSTGSASWTDANGQGLTETRSGTSSFAVFEQRDGTVKVSGPVTVGGMQFAPTLSGSVFGGSGHYILNGDPDQNNNIIKLDGIVYSNNNIYGVSQTNTDQESTGLIYNPSGKVSIIHVGDGSLDSYRDIGEINTVVGDTSSDNGKTNPTTLVKTDAGILILGNTQNSYAGGTVVTDGTVQIADNGSLGKDGTTLSLDGGALAMGQSGIDVSSHPILLSTVGGTTSAASGGQLNLNGQANTTVSSPISGSGSLIVASYDPTSSLVSSNSQEHFKDDVNLNITGRNTYTGSTYIAGLGGAGLAQPTGGTPFSVTPGHLTVNANTENPFGDSQAKSSVYISADSIVNMNGNVPNDSSSSASLGQHNVLVNSSTLNFKNSSTASAATITTNSLTSGAGYQTDDTKGALVHFTDNSTASGATINNQNAGNNYFSTVLFDRNSKADSAIINNSSGSGLQNLVHFSGDSTAYDPNSSNHAQISNYGSILIFDGNSQAGRTGEPYSNNDGAIIQNHRSALYVPSEHIVYYGVAASMLFSDNSHAGNAIIYNGPVDRKDLNQGNVLTFSGNSNADTSHIVNGFRDNLYFKGSSSAGISLVTNDAGAIYFADDGGDKAKSATIENISAFTTGLIDLSQVKTGSLHIGSLQDDLSVQNNQGANILLGGSESTPGNDLFLGGNNNTETLTTEITGYADLIKEGKGKLTLRTLSNDNGAKDVSGAAYTGMNNYYGTTRTTDGVLDLQASVKGDLVNNGNNDGSGNTIVDQGVTVGGSLTNNAASNGSNTAGITYLESGSVISKDANLNGGVLWMKDGSAINGTLYAKGGQFSSGNAFAGSLGGVPSTAPGYLTGTLTLTGNVSNEYDGVLYGTGGLKLQENDGTNATQTLGGRNTYSGTTTIDKGRKLVLIGNGRLLQASPQSSNTYVQNDGTLDIKNNADTADAQNYTAFQQKVLGTGDLTQESNGFTELLSGSNYTGSTSASGGVVQVDADSKIGDSVVNNDFGSGSTLAGQGTIVGTTTVEDGATLRTGDYNRFDSYGAQKFTIDGDLILKNGARQENGPNSESLSSQSGGATTVIRGDDTLAKNNDGTQQTIYSSAYGKNFDRLNSDLLKVTGTATLGGTLTMSLPTNGSWNVGQAYRVMEVDKGITPGTNGNKNFANFQGVYAYLNPQLVIDHDQSSNDSKIDYVDILLLQSSGGFSVPGKTPNEITTGHGLDHLPNDNPLRSAVSGLPAGVARQVLNNLSGEIHASVRTGLIQDAFLIRNAVLNRLANDDCTYGRHGQSTYDMKTHRKNDDVCSSEHLVLWGQAYGSMGHNSGGGNAAGMGHNTAGFILGADTPIRGTNWHAGGLVGYGHSGFNSGGRASSASSNNLTVGGYAGTHWGHVHLRLGGTYSWNMINTRRQIAVGSYGGRVNSHYLGGTAQAFAELGYRMHAGRSVIEPFMNVAYVNMQTNRFRERGNDAALLGRGRDTGVTFSSFGVRAGSQFRAGRMLLMPHVMVAYRHGFGGMVSHQRAGFAAAGSSNDMNVAGVLLSDNAAVIDTGLTARITDRMDIDLSYVGQYGNHSVDSGATGSVRMYF